MVEFYLAHNFGQRKMIRKWELKIEFKYNIDFNNPFYDSDRSDIKVLDKLKEGSQEQIDYIMNRDTNLIVDGDLELIRKGDGLVAYLKPSKKFTTMIGTPMEIFFAARVLQIPVYIITDRYAYHPWIKKYATKIFPNRKSFEKFIRDTYGVKN